MTTKRLFIFLFLFGSVINVQAAEKKLLLSPVPVNIKPVNYNESRYGLGYNLTTLTTDYIDPFFTSQTEKVGELKFTVHNLVAGYLKSKNDVSTSEYDLLVGKVESQSNTPQYFSKAINKNVQFENTGNGFDIGVRGISSRTLYRQMGRDGRRLVDWNYALSLHAAFYTMNSTFKGESVDKLDLETYEEEETGIFLRPVAALQPIIYLYRNLSIVPFLGVGTKLTASSYYWQDKEYKRNGVSQPGQIGEGYGTELKVTGLETHMGFDIGIITSSEKKHELTIGGAISKLFASESADFTEVHVLYSTPYF